MIDNFSIHIAFTQYEDPNTHTYRVITCITSCFLTLTHRADMMFWANFTYTSLLILFLRSRLLQEVEGLETEEIERVSYLVPCLACACQYIYPVFT